MQVELGSCVILNLKPLIPIVSVSTNSPGYVCSENNVDFLVVHGPIENNDLSDDNKDNEEEL